MRAWNDSTDDSLRFDYLTRDSLALLKETLKPFAGVTIKSRPLGRTALGCSAAVVTIRAYSIAESIDTRRQVKAAIRAAGLSHA